MTAIIEKKIKQCKNCERNTKHERNANTSSGFMILMHILLIILTAGIWLPIIVLYKVLFAKIGGWICRECGR